MRTTIDRAGRLVLPKALRDQVGIRAGDVEVFVEGTGIRVEAIAIEDLAEEHGRLVIPSAGVELDDETVRVLRDACQR
jgi:AbrB family looped-hinge helix DNA binding protein